MIKIVFLQALNRSAIKDLEAAVTRNQSVYEYLYDFYHNTESRFKFSAGHKITLLTIGNDIKNLSIAEFSKLINEVIFGRI